MPTHDPADNKSYYAKLKQDPEKIAKLRVKQAEYQRRRRAKARAACEPGVITGVEAEPVMTEPESGMTWITIPNTGPLVLPESEPDITEPIERKRPHLGGKHSSSGAQGEISLSLEDIIKQWHGRWADDLMG